MISRVAFVEDILRTIDEMVALIEERELLEGDGDLSIARELAEQLREEVDLLSDN